MTRTTTDVEPAANDPAYDALAELFLGGPDLDEMPERPTGPSRAAVNAPIEALVLGHLPVFASAWVTQYAREQSRRIKAPVALVRVFGGHTSIELIGDVPSNRPVYDHLYGAIEDAAGRAGCWILRVGETVEPDLVSVRGVDRVTLLSGADEAAVVSAYRTIKSLFGEAGGPDVELGVAILGSAREQAEGAGEKLRRAGEAFLSRRVGVRVCSARVSPSPARTLYRGRTSESLPELIELIGDSRPNDAPPERTEPTPDRHPVAVDLTELERAPALHVDAFAGQDVASFEAPAAEDDAMLRDSALPGETTGSDAVEALARLGLLADHVGLRAIAARCPYASGIELASDDSGRLHLLGRVGSATREQAVERLTTVAGWARDHAGLLRLVSDGLEAANPVMHVVTENAGEARRLIDAGVCVHQLVPVRLDGRTGWACVQVG